ncbi:hypothetical protein EDB81DRAFT_765690 [Dactylonectria macrodidyma]|uniref:Uncharacterized protein n=1 Tax=Dactylonectria macrodidyma TaxID=307937 RepID=A0A9P9DR64_9HYPO|nr:hypothetical protein EDB81DRAFT_765690 [Dactylonectria macrodidyma]
MYEMRCPHLGKDMKCKARDPPQQGTPQQQRLPHHNVRLYQSIQDAIDAASRGDQILVEGSTYAKQLTVKKGGIALVRRDAIPIPLPSLYKLLFDPNWPRYLRNR